MPLRHLVALFIFPFSLWLATTTWAGNEDIRLQTLPALDKARPFSGPVKILLTIVDNDENPIEAGRVRARLYAPLPSRLFSTDFPHVEGTLLLDMELPFSNGSVAWEYLFPIRGDYRLEVELADPSKENIKRVFNLSVKEHRYKLFYLGCLLVVLFLLGLIAGRLFTGQRANHGLNMKLSLFLSILPLAMGLTGDIQTKKETGSKPVTGLEVSPAVVGKISWVHWNLMDPRTGEPVASRLSLAITHLEKGKQIFSIKNVPTEGNFMLGFQFADASDHLLAVVAESEDSGPVQEKRVMTVTGLDPPRETFFPPMILFLAVLALGLATGRISCRRKT